ncbi:MAG: hypothetical protein FWE22_08325 [Firmicutes bacterium]|nr:hypothetical protein [Bacillota bacterium]
MKTKDNKEFACDTEFCLFNEDNICQINRVGVIDDGKCTSQILIKTSKENIEKLKQEIIEELLKF